MRIISSKLINSDKKTEKLFIYILAPLTVMAILLGVFALKGIYPFGNETVDYYDMSQEVVAVYHHIFDYLHGDKIPLIDWYTGLGMNMYNGTSGCNVFDPFNLLLLLFSREKLLEGMSALLIIKLMLMTGAFGYFLSKQFPTADVIIKYSLAVGYGLCGYVMMHYTILPWLDCAILFPILIIQVIKLIKEGKVAGYTVVLALMLMTNYYLSAMSLLYIVFGVGLYICSIIISKNTDDIGDKKRFHLIELALSTGVSFVIASFALVPQIMQVLSSTRFDNNGGYLDALKAVRSPYASKIWALLGMALPFVLIVKGFVSEFISRDKAKKGRLVWVLGILVITCLELVVEGNNLLLHFGSYIHYPIRNGFIIYFTIASLAVYYSERMNAEEEKSKNKNKNNLRTVLGLISVIAAIVLSVIAIIYYSRRPGMNINQLIKVTKILGLIFASIFAFAIVVAKSARKWTLPLILFAQLTLYAYIFIGPVSFYADYMREPEQEAEYIRIANQCTTNMDMQADITDRIKNPDTSLNANYGFIMRRSTLSNMTHLLMKDTMDGAVELGYSIMFTRLLDVGGTEFTDAMLHVKNVISCMEQDPDIYEEIDRTQVVADHRSGEKRDYYYYQRKYVLPFTMLVSDINDLNSIAEVTDIVSFHNNTYSELAKNVNLNQASGDEFAQLLCPAEEGDSIVHVKGKKILYFWGGCADQEYSNMTILINGNEVPVPTIMNYDNTRYPAHFNNNTIYIGQFEDEDVDIEVVLDHSIEDVSYYAGFFTLDVDMLSDLCDLENSIATANGNEAAISGNKISCNVKAGAGNYLMLPVAYNKGFQAKVNGKTVEVLNVKGVFTAVQMDEGKNQVEIIYYPEGFKAGLILTITGLLLFAGFMFAERKLLFEKALMVRLDILLGKIYLLVWSLAVLIVYIVPTIMNLVYRVI